MKAYLIENTHEFEGSELVAVFTDETIADRLCEALQATVTSRFEDYDVTEVEIDLRAEEIALGKLPYRVIMNRIGGTSMLKVDPSGMHDSHRLGFGGAGAEMLDFTCMASSQADAVEKCDQKRLELQRSGEWDTRIAARSG